MTEKSGSTRSVFRHGLFEGKVAIVTGGGTGMGKAITSELLALGSNVVIASRKLDKLQATASELKSKATSGNSVVAVQCNIRNEDEVVRLMKETLKLFGKIDFLVNNGGGQFPSAAENITKKGWHAVIETNLTGTFVCCREAYKQWMASHGGVIVNIIAVMRNGFPGMIHTGAARAGVENLTKTLALEWADKGIRIISVAPGITYSETAVANYDDPQILLGRAQGVPMKRLSTVEEISSVVCFLLSPGASYVTGTTFSVDGGYGINSTRMDLMSILSKTPVFEVPPHRAFPVYGGPLPTFDPTSSSSSSSSPAISVNAIRQSKL